MFIQSESDPSHPVSGNSKEPGHGVRPVSKRFVRQLLGWVCDFAVVHLRMVVQRGSPVKTKLPFISRWTVLHKGMNMERREGISNNKKVRSPGNSLSLSRKFGTKEEEKMHDLKSLQQEFPVLDDGFLEFCASHGILSLEDFLLHDLYALVGFAECQASSAELKQVLVNWIDSLLEGGFCEGKFIELVGSSSSGKTQVCLAAAAHIAHKYMCTVMFLDTCSSFSSKRIACNVNGLLELLQKETLGYCVASL
ncbi:DNA repair RAD51-like protein 4 [Nymphaea thermarum]|nr:DNA repair RAD51-like protein 4 [Nymphaea thermarum]